jgi:hypothetical protein
VEVVGQLADGAEVDLLGARAEAGQLKILEHPLTENRGHVMVLSQREEEEPLRRTLANRPGTCQRSLPEPARIHTTGCD